MSDFDPTDAPVDDESDDTDDGSPAGYVEMNYSDLAALEKSAADLPHLQAAERDLAFTRAGVDLTTARGQLFADVFDGPLDVEAIQAEGAVLGVLRGQQEEVVSEGPQITDAELALGAGRSGLVSGAQAETGWTPDPNEKSRAAFESARERGSSREDAWAEAMSVRVEAALKGDQRVLAP